MEGENRRHDEDEDEEIIVVPGQRVGHTEDYAAGEGTYVRGSYLYASVLGRRRIFSAVATGEGGSRERVCVEKVSSSASSLLQASGGTTTTTNSGVWVPRAGDLVTGVVVRVTPRVAAVNIACVGSRALPETFSGIVRSQDVRATATDQVELYKAFRPGDVIRAEVLSLGDARSYFLSTARNDLGVVSAAHSVSGATMVPLSWNLMLCPKTNMTEPRKVAKLTSP